MSSAKILIVDDDQLVIYALQRTLKLQGYSTIGTLNPIEAIKIVEEQDIAIIISDQRMPRMSGIEVLLHVRELSPSTVRILISAYSDIDVVISAINSGQIFKYITKPWNEKELLQAIEAAISYRKEILEKENMVIKIRKETDDWKLVFAELHMMIDQNKQNTVQALQAVVQVKDNNLLQHSLRVSKHAVKIGTLMGLSIERLVNLEYAGIFHDIGKIAIRDQILYKAGRLDDSEYSLMKSHASYGAEILGNIKFMEEIAEIVLQHHEHFDGSGYPRGLAGNQILLEGKIIAVADAYDALISDRVYRAALPLEEVYKILLEESGTNFDPEVVKWFVEVK